MSDRVEGTEGNREACAHALQENYPKVGSDWAEATPGSARRQRKPTAYGTVFGFPSREEALVYGNLKCGKVSDPLLDLL
jgi:hypothetical protein